MKRQSKRIETPTMSSIVDQTYWDSGYENLKFKYREDNILFKDIFERFLEAEGTCFEVGCYPGGYLIYLGKKYNYTVSGIDRTPYIESRLPMYLESEGITRGHLFNEDFLHFETKETYDVVCSFGFLEHFSDLDTIVQKHINLVKPSGILILACPNFRKGQYLFHRTFDSENLSRHVLSTMNISRWRDILSRNNMDVLYDGYYKTVDFWTESFPSSAISQRILLGIQHIAKKVDSHIHIPNRWFSPYLISVSKKR